jgi:hypothetical protein
MELVWDSTLKFASILLQSAQKWAPHLLFSCNPSIRLHEMRTVLPHYFRNTWLSSDVMQVVNTYGFADWNGTLNLPKSDNRDINERRIFGLKRDEVTGGWRKLHNEELHSLYSSHRIVRVIKGRRMRWAGHVARMGEVRGAYNILVRRPEGRRPLGRPRRRWEDNI